MKKILLVLLVVMLGTTAAQAQTDSSRNRFHYYAEENVYYNPTTLQYSWWDGTNSIWSSGSELPASITIRNRNKYNTIQYNGTDVWTANGDHVKMYGKKKSKSATPPL